jgi:hypothetical protein
MARELLTSLIGHHFCMLSLGLAGAFEVCSQSHTRLFRTVRLLVPCSLFKYFQDPLHVPLRYGASVCLSSEVEK